ncbi:MAG: sugar phosphate isomerase/epimerase [Fimbriimonadaceae bacterium]|nr:sugar phosphate isomerase/epimerase [Fimbriimonadaceae bacterium]
MEIGVRQPPCAGKMGFEAFCEWCAEVGFAAIDVPRLTPEVAKALADHGLRVGTVDLPAWGAQLSPDPARRQAGLAEQREILSKAKELGASVAFAVLLPEDHSQSRANSFEYWKESAPDFVALLDELDMHLALEAWPGPGPWLPTLGCTPETLRAMFAAVPSERLGLCFDPSHLVRLGIDYQRFLWEFGSRVKHCHGKDTELLDEQLYLTGNISPSFGAKYGYGECAWRYCIPGDGEVDWTFVAHRLKDFGYDNLVCVELEDCHYFPEVELQQEGLINSIDFLAEVFY